MSPDNKHITKEELTKFHNNELSDQKLAAFLQHITECTYCADQFAESFEPVLISAPVNLKEQILTAKRPFKQLSAKKQFFLYSTKVCVAMCGALILLFTISFSSIPDIQAQNRKKEAIQTETEWKAKKAFTTSINTSMDAFATRINNRMSSIVSDSAKENTP